MLTTITNDDAVYADESRRMSADERERILFLGIRFGFTLQSALSYPGYDGEADYEDDDDDQRESFFLLSLKMSCCQMLHRDAISGGGGKGLIPGLSIQEFPLMPVV